MTEALRKYLVLQRAWQDFMAIGEEALADEVLGVMDVKEHVSDNNGDSD